MRSSPIQGASIPRYGSHTDVIGLPANAVTITNSERSQAHCDRRWYFGTGIGLGGRSTVPMDFGSAGHECLEDVWRWWMVTDAPYHANGLDDCLWCGLGVDQH